MKYDLAPGEYLGYISLYSSDYSKSILHAAYDDKNDIVYVYTYNADGDGLMFQTYDPDTNTFTHIKTELGEGTLAADPIITMGYNPLDGFVYAVTLYEEKWIRIDTENGEYEDLNTIAFSPAYYTQAMVYSPNDFGFVYVGIDVNEETYVMVVEPETGAIKSKTLSIKEEEYAFMYCSDQAVVNNAPAMPEIKEITFEGAATSGKAIVVAPTVTFDGSQITESLEMIVKIDDVTIDTRTVTAGQEVEIALNNVANGKHTFSVVCNSTVEGAIATREFFVGYDTPAAPQNVVLTETLLTWDAVTAGINGGILESSVVTYNVYIDGVKQNDAPIEGTSFEVNIATDVMTKIQAAVEAVCGSKVSEKTYSNILAVGAYQLPLELVCDEEFVNNLTIVDANDDGVCDVTDCDEAFTDGCGTTQDVNSAAADHILVDVSCNFVVNTLFGQQDGSVLHSSQVAAGQSVGELFAVSNDDGLELLNFQQFLNLICNSKTGLVTGSTLQTEQTLRQNLGFFGSVVGDVQSIQNLTSDVLMSCLGGVTVHISAIS